MITLRRHQPLAVDAVEDAFRAGEQRPLVDACVGSGKSLMMAELARREVSRGGRVIIGAHVRELVEQNAAACKMLNVPVGINAAALGQRTWRGPVISAAIQSVHRHAHAFGPISLLCVDEAHMVPHSESGMYRELIRALGNPRVAGFSGTVFRLQGGSLVEGEGAPFSRVVYTYSILDGIRDGYLVPAFSLGADDKIDTSKLRVRQGEFTAESSDAQMIALMDNHIVQMVHYGQDRRAWLIFEAGTKAAKAMAQRMNEFGIPTGLVLGETPAGERIAIVESYRQGRLRALVNVVALSTGFDVQHVDMIVDRAPTKSLGRHIQKMGRMLRCVGGNINASIAAGKPDAALLDFADNVSRHGPLDFIRHKETKSRLVPCEACGTRNGAAARKCWKCDAPMLKNCPACLHEVQKGTLDCPHCGYDMRQGDRTEPKKPSLAEVPSGAALIKAWDRSAPDREGGWQAIRKCYASPDGVIVDTAADRFTVPPAMEAHAPLAKWIRVEAGTITAMLVPNGQARSSALQIDATGKPMPVPMPAVVEAVRAA